MSSKRSPPKAFSWNLEDIEEAQNSVPEEFADKMTSLETKWNAKRAKAEGRPMVPYCK